MTTQEIERAAHAATDALADFDRAGIATVLPTVPALVQALRELLAAVTAPTPPADDAREALATHACEECSTCGVHDGRHDKCCGCYDGVCCQEKREDLEVRERLYNIIRWGTENDEMRTVDRILAEVRPSGTVTDAETVRVVGRLATTTGMSAAQVTATILAFTQPSEAAVARGARIIRSVYGDQVASAESVARSVLSGTVTDAEVDAALDVLAGAFHLPTRPTMRAALEAARKARS